MKTGVARSSAAKASAARAAAIRAATLAAAAAAVAEPDAEPATQVLPEFIPSPGEEAEPVLVAALSVPQPFAADASGADASVSASIELMPETELLPGSAETELLPVPAPAATKPPVVKRTSRKRARVIAPTALALAPPVVLAVSGLHKSFGRTVAVSGIDLEVRAGSFFGIVGPNGAGKTTTLSMVTGLLRPDAGTVTVNGIDVWGSPMAAKRIIGVLPDRLRLFDRLTGAQLLYYSGVLRGLDDVTVRQRAADLATAFGLEDALNRLVADYSAGMTKKIALACAMIHSPRLLVLDEPFESVDPVSAVNVTEILQKYVASGGTVVLSSHGMDLIQRVCDHVAIIVEGAVLASGTIDEVRGEKTLEERFIELAGGRKVAEGMEWLHSFSD
ncbi:ABC transporter ATP-binding protein [Cryobacterium sp. TMT2-42-4]|uniref:ABC transporter ATP-binding protein n=1 Tax=Cryobacterium sp. TMT2-42-4 TaxID=1259255 RepID=UPI001F545AC0|nr:ABC transporter ATP-binding protein [Cryobacterium sp. TMT2-42-4]